jgi:hypothetical protein
VVRLWLVFAFRHLFVSAGITSLDHDKVYIFEGVFGDRLVVLMRVQALASDEHLQLEHVNS